MGALVALYHFEDYWAAHCELTYAFSRPAIREQLDNEFPSFKMIRDAWEWHVQTTGKLAYFRRSATIEGRATHLYLRADIDRYWVAVLEDRNGASIARRERQIGV